MPLVARFARSLRLVVLVSTPLFVISASCAQEGGGAANTHEALVELFLDWREFERPPNLDGAPDYTAERFAQRYEEFADYRARLDAFDIDGWTVEHKVDWHLVNAEMNGFDFNHRILKPWVRDPAYYQSIWTYRSDVPGHEGPTHHAVLELWTYDLPLSDSEEERMISELAVIPPLMAQAQQNLTGNARDLWVAGIRNIQRQRTILDSMAEDLADEGNDTLMQAIADAQVATDELVAWLQAEEPSKDGPSGLGRENYEWYQQHVHYVPLTFEQERFLLERELDRSWSTLKLEEHANRALPEQVAAATEEEYNALAEESVQELVAFLDEQEIMTWEPYMEPALREHMGTFVPADERNFFWIVTHIDALPLYSHFYHWIELARMDNEPHESPVRQGSLLYNIFDSGNEGKATGVEEMFMHAGLYANNPRSRELVWIMLAQRAARGLGSLDAHANEMTMAEAGTVHVYWTPRGWMNNEPELLQFEQHLYLRQPGYGTSYVTGKYLLERTLAHRTKQMELAGEEYTLKMFFDELAAADSIPIALTHWQLTGDDSDIRKIMDSQ
ncbi:MAG: hypothetical protein QNJ00_04715 [Woeseiaceae bacterium]|nr:hypothetical protein [Woeseiaceae bacterium]